MSRYPNVLPERERNGMWRKDGYSSGPIRDGHALLRNECDEDGIEIVHPKECERSEGGDGLRFVHFDCPLAYEMDWKDSPLEMYCEGEEGVGDLDERLPRGQEVPIIWEAESGANWTDYGWEYDGSVTWWFGDEPWLTEKAA